MSWQAAVQPNKAQIEATMVKSWATWEKLCAIKHPHGEGEPAGIAEPPTASEGSVAWEDDGTLQW